MSGKPSSPDVEAYQLMRAGKFSEALPLAERAVAGAMRCLPSHGMLAAILLQLGRAADAAAVITRAAELDSGIADAYDGLAYVSLALGWHERANDFYRRATTLQPTEPRFWYNLACSERSLGNLADAEAACDRAVSIDAAQYPSFLLRSELRVQTPQFNHVEELQRGIERPDADYRAQVFLGYALAKELDDVQSFDEAFARFSAAARARRGRLQYEVGADEQKLRRIAQVYSEPLAGALPGNVVERRSVEEGRTPAEQGSVDSARFIFIVGLPRSGTTLVERILTGLSGVRSNGETENFSRSLFSAAAGVAGAGGSGAVGAAGGSGAGDIFDRAAAVDPRVVAMNYARVADVRGGSDKIVEKLPMNYLYLGAIARALPEAKLLVLRRSPLDSCFAMYRTLFGEAYPFSYDLEELARYYAAYDRLVGHWRKVLGDRLHEIIYEDLVREPSRVGAAAAAYCGLPWSDEAIDIQKNAAVSLTASAAQVRRPIYGSSSGRWRHYRAHLQPLIDALRRQGVTLPADAWGVREAMPEGRAGGC
jgi:tetratricopeptide (TPR) repeat protein